VPPEQSFSVQVPPLQYVNGPGHSAEVVQGVSQYCPVPISVSRMLLLSVAQV
jgi:hypothetical protein